MVGIPLSCWIADRASGGTFESAWAWGLLGPPGWVIAALRGVQVVLLENVHRDAEGRQREQGEPE